MRVNLSVLTVCLSLSIMSSHVLAEDKVVNIYNWSDYISEEALEGFTKRTGIKVVYDVYDSNETLQAKLLTGSSGYDVVFTTARPFATNQIKSGIYQKFDKSKLTNFANLDPAILKSLADVDAKNEYTAPYMWGTTGIGYNEKKVKEVLGANAPVNSWALMFDPAHAKKLASCGMTILDDEVEGLAAVMVALGRPPASGTVPDLDAAMNTFARIRPHVRYFHSSRYIDDLANGEICVAMGYSGDVMQARDRAEEAKNGVVIKYSIPKEGAVRWVDLMAIPKDAPNPGNAHLFINYLLEPAVIAGISNYVGYANGNAKATALVDKEVRSNPGVYPPAEVARKLVDNTTSKPDEAKARVRAWTKIKSGK
jgi:putrescine transport system substrate-binding protein